VEQEQKHQLILLKKIMLKKDNNKELMERIRNEGSYTVSMIHEYTGEPKWREVLDSDLRYCGDE